MKHDRRHQCLIYAGDPASQLKSIRILLTDRLKDGYRCIYMNKPAMVLQLKSLLNAAGVDVDQYTNSGALILSSDQNHLEAGHFNVNKMISMLQTEALRSQTDGFEGLWASGDMTWELGNQQNLQQLLAYECMLEKLFHETPALNGLCQYHMDTLPCEYVQDALHAHPSLYINESLSMINPHYIPPDILAEKRPVVSESKLQKILKSLGLASYPLKAASAC